MDNPVRHRMFHRATLRDGSAVGRSVSWLDGFHDLVYVALFVQLASMLYRLQTMGTALAFAGLFVPSWLLWMSYTFYSNRFDVDDAVHRAMVFGQMLCVVVMAMSVPAVFAGDPSTFSFAFATARFIQAGMYARIWNHIPEVREFSRQRFLAATLAGALWAVGGVLGAPYGYLLWSLAVGVQLLSVWAPRSLELLTRYSPDTRKMTEHFGLLTLVILGVTVLQMVQSCTDLGVSVSVVYTAGIGLTITCSLWWIYFDDVGGSRIKSVRLAAFMWVYAHLPMMASLTAVGAGVQAIVHLDPSVPAPASVRWLLVTSLSATFLFVGLIDAVTERRQAELSDRARVLMRLVSAVGVLALAPAGEHISAGWFLAGVALAGLVQVGFDLSMAPLALARPAHENEEAQLLRRPEAKNRSNERPLRDVANSVRVGTPSDMRRDLYFHLMSGSWLRVLATLALSYLGLNVLFASLYMLDAGSIVDGRANNFMDAFSFSVQTMSTIGYGALSPANDYGDMLVTIQSAVGLLFNALATGLMFAKASVARASVLFSEPIVISQRHGRPTLMLRLANARGNELVEATIRLTLLQDEVSPEGHRTRLLHDLKLRRDTSPVFALSWTVFHDLDESSPLHGVTQETIDDRMFSIIATMTGYDATYAQTVHARKLWLADDVYFNHRFIDVIHDLPDGRIMINYEDFHRIESEAGSAES